MALRVTRVAAQVAGSVTSGALRVTRVSAQVAGAVTDGSLRVTRVSAQVAGNTGTANTLQISQLRIQVGTTSTSEQHLFTSELGTGISSLGSSTMVLGLPPAYLGTLKTLTAEHVLSLTQTGDAEVPGAGEVIVTASNTLTLTDSGDRNIVAGRTGSSTLTLTQQGVLAGPRDRDATQTLTLTQSAASSILTRTGTSVLSLTDTANVGGEKILTASNTLSLSQSAASNILTRTANSPLTLTQTNIRVNASVNGIDLTASNTLSLSQTNNRVNVKASGTALTADHTLTFTQRAIFPIELTGSHTLSFTQTGDGNAGKSGTHTLTFTQSAIANKVASYTASNTLVLTQDFTWVQLRDGLVVLGDQSCNATQQYAPFSGGGNSPVRPVPPSLVKKSDVLFFYPYGATCDATTSITLRTPNFGDRDRNQYNRINRESRGGSLRIYRDPDWPKIRTLVMSFSGVKDSEVDSVLAFLEATLGLRVGFRDWQNRVWSGVITTPDASIIRQGTNLNDISIEMEVDDVYLQPNACDTLTLTQSADVELVPA